MSTLPSRTRDWTSLAVFLYGTLAAALVSFVVYGAQHLVAATIDLNGFGALSRQIAQGHGFSLGFGPTLRRAPLYPLMGGALLKLFGLTTPGLSDDVAYRPLLGANCVIFGLTCLTVWALARRLFGPRVALLAAALCPLVPQSLRYVGMTEVETLMGLFIALLAFTGLNLVERPSLATGVWFGLTAAAATLTKPVAEFYPVLFLLLAWWYWRSVCTRQPESAPVLLTRPRVVATCAALLCFILPLVPWVVRNMTVTDGQFIGISSNGPGEFLRGYVNAQPKYYLLRQTFSGAWDAEANVYEQQILQQHDVPFYRFSFDSTGKPLVTPPVPKGVTSAQIEAQKDRIESTEMKHRLLHAPADFVRKFLIQLFTFWYVVETRTKSLIVGVIALIVLAFALLGLRHDRRRDIPTWPIVALIVYLNLVYAVSLAFARYSMPLYPTLLVLTAGGIASLVPRFFFRASPAPHQHPLEVLAHQRSAPSSLS